MMFLSFILLFLLIKTLQEEQYYKLIEGEQFYIMSQEDENDFIYYQKIKFRKRQNLANIVLIKKYIRFIKIKFLIY